MVLFGLAECASLLEKKQQVDKVLEFLTGRQITFKDLFHLGSYRKKSGTQTHDSSPQPKLSTASDRRMVLVEKQKLKNFHIAHLFIREDLPVGLRRTRRQLPSKVANGNVSHSNISDVTLLQPEPVTMLSGDASGSQADSYST